MNIHPQRLSDAIETLVQRYHRVRECSANLVASLSAEDAVVQSMPDASPAKWHLAHTTWFFERFILSEFVPGYRCFHEQFDYLFNSYYQSVGEMHARTERGLLSRPSLAEIHGYRAHVDAAMCELLEAEDESAPWMERLLVGLNHEQQHQELLLTDIKHLFSRNPLEPALHPGQPSPHSTEVVLRFLAGTVGIAEIGAPDTGFAYDNERPRHRVFLHEHVLANRPVNNAEFRAFIYAGGYRTPGLWLSDGWDTLQRDGWKRPLYWSEDLCSEFTLGGRREIDPLAPVCHLCYFEADAFARWAGARLPTEAEWETRARSDAGERGNFQDSGALHPRPPSGDVVDRAVQMLGDVWEWTASPYVGYPGFRTLEGSLGEYNGKFMNGQWVLRGGSCATPADHIRISYRNFFYPAARWQFAGLRLAKDAP